MLLKESIKIPLPKEVYTLYSNFKKRGFELYLVGGSVRDFLLGRSKEGTSSSLRVGEGVGKKKGNLRGDFDFATSALPEQMMGLFQRTIPTGVKHGTVTILIEKQSYEVTTYRCESAFKNHRHPDRVTFSRTLSEDLRRRDFTINAFAYDITEGVVLDYFKGKEDLVKQQIKAIGEPKKRFEEDALRMMRACRFASKLGFEIEKKTLEAMREKGFLLEMISKERLRDELIKMLTAPYPDLGIEVMRDTRLLKKILPELDKTIGVRQNKYHKYDVYHHTLHVLKSFLPSENDLVLRFSALFHDIAKPSCKRISPGKTEAECTFYNHEIIGAKVATKVMRRLCFSKDQIRKTSHLIANHMFHYTEQWSDGAVRRFLKRVGEENLESLFLLRQADRMGNGLRLKTCPQIEAFKKRIAKCLLEENALKITDLDLSGHDLIKTFSLKPSKTIGFILNHLLEKVLDEPSLNEKQTLLNLARFFLKPSSPLLEKEKTLPSKKKHL